MSVPSGRSPRIGSQAVSETPGLDSRVGGVENEIVSMKAARVAKREERVFVTLRGAGIYDVPHNLGAVPILCELKEIVSTSGAIVHGLGSPYRKGEWNATLCRMDVTAVVGSLDGCIATFIVKVG